jgi:alpha-glucosidase
MLEAYGTLDEMVRYYGTPSAPGGHFPFNFRFITDINNSSSAESFSEIINEYLGHMSDGRTPNWVVSTPKDRCVVHDTVQRLERTTSRS